MVKLKKKKPNITPTKILPVQFVSPFGLVTFDVESSTEQIEWSFEKVGRQIEVSMFAQLSDIKLYKQIHSEWFGTNFVKDALLRNDSPTYVDGLFGMLKQKKILFDMMIIEATIAFEDISGDYFGEFTQYHGLSFTVNGKKYLELP